MIIVALGGAIGAAARYLTSGWAEKALGSGFPWGTALVNIVGCFLIGFLMTLGLGLVPMRIELRLFLVTGILGGFTTFSTFGYETVRLLRDGALLAALANAGINLILGLAAVALGTWTARAL